VEIIIGHELKDDLDKRYIVF